MNRLETAKVLAVLEVAYPHSFKGRTKEQAELALELWTEMFAERTYQEVSVAVRAYMSQDESGFAPTIGQINGLIVDSMESGMSAQEASAILSKAVSRSGWHAAEEFEKLPETIRRVVGSPQMLKEWSQLDSSVFNTVVLSNFQRSYKQTAEHERQDKMLPPSVKDFINRLKNPDNVVALEERTGE